MSSVTQSTSGNYYHNNFNVYEQRSISLKPFTLDFYHLHQLRQIIDVVGLEAFNVWWEQVNNPDNIFFNPPTEEANQYRLAEIVDLDIRLSEETVIVSLPCRFCGSTDTRSVEGSNRGMDEGGAISVQCRSCGKQYREA